jgi:hypothetical protein
MADCGMNILNLFPSIGFLPGFAVTLPPAPVIVYKNSETFGLKAFCKVI